MTFLVSVGNKALQELSHHPVHLTFDKEGNLPPSAFVPFCSYQEDSNLLGQGRSELDNMTVCEKFKPVILEGQLCYSLNITKYKKKPTKVGKRNGLFLLIDNNPYQVNSSARKAGESKEQDTFKVYIHTLSQDTAFGPGAYAMHSLKSMTGTESFEQLPCNQKKCHIHDREECQTEKFLAQVESNCNCVPWSLITNSSKEKAIAIKFNSPHFYRHTSSAVQRVRLALQGKH